MKTIFKKSWLSGVLTVMCILTVMCVMLTVASMPVSAGVEVKGLVYASQITDKGLVLTGNTNLVMDRDLVLTSISGNYDLTVSGSGKLTVWAKWIKSDAISVASLNVQTDLQVEAGSEEHCAIYATKGVRFTGDSLDVKGCTGIRTTGGDVVMDAVEVTITASHGAGVIANSGSVLITPITWRLPAARAEKQAVRRRQFVPPVTANTASLAITAFLKSGPPTKTDIGRNASAVKRLNQALTATKTPTAAVISARHR